RARMRIRASACSLTGSSKEPSMIKRKLLAVTVASCATAWTQAPQAAELLSPSQGLNATILLDHVVVDGQSHRASLVALNADTGLQVGQIFRLETIQPTATALAEDGHFYADDALLFISGLR